MINEINSIAQFKFQMQRAPAAVLIFYRDKDNKSENILKYVRKLSLDNKYVYVTFLSINFDYYSEIVEYYNLFQPATLLFIKNNKIIRKLINSDNTGLINSYLYEIA